MDAVVVGRVDVSNHTRAGFLSHRVVRRAGRLDNRTGTSMPSVVTLAESIRSSSVLYDGFMLWAISGGRVVDLTLFVDLKAASQSDAIEDTVNYAEITDLVVEEITSNPVNLIEKLAARIAERVLNQHIKVISVTVTVHKPQAPVAAQLKDIAVVVTRAR